MESVDEGRRIRQDEENIQENTQDFQCGEMRVHLRFAEDGPDLAEILTNYFISLKQG